jgi:hypothetical protein
MKPGLHNYTFLPILVEQSTMEEASSDTHGSKSVEKKASRPLERKRTLRHKKSKNVMKQDD